MSRNIRVTLKPETASTGIGLFGLVFLVFLIFKLAEIGVVASWSWWWVTAPLWGPFALIVGIFVTVLVVVGLVAGIAALISKMGRKRSTPRRPDLSNFRR